MFGLEFTWLIGIAVLLLVGALYAGGNRPDKAENSPFMARLPVMLASFTVSAQTGSGSGATRNVAVQLRDAANNAINFISHLEVFLSDSADGHTLTAVAPTTLAIGTNGVVIGVITTVKTDKLISNASGQFDLTITESGTPNTYYLVVCMPNGTIAVSPAIAMT